MGIRIPIEVRKGDVIVKTVALANSGYESEEPEALIPLALAKRLTFSLEGLRSERYRVVGSEVSTYVLGYVDVRLAVEERRSDWVRARAVSVPGEFEVILSDMLIESLGVELVKPKSGLWRISGEETLRRSYEPEYWVE